MEVKVGVPIEFFNSPLSKGDVLKAKIQIVDRMLHISNEVETGSFMVGQE